MKLIVCLVVLLAVAAAPAAAAEFYRYVDANGNVRFTDNINQVPEAQRAKARSYVESQSRPTAGGTKEADNGDTGGTPPADPPAMAGIAQEGESVDGVRQRLEAMKAEVEKDYQSLVKEKEVLAKEKEAHKSREEIAAYNKKVETFNQRAELYDKKSNELRKLVDEFNARVIEENANSTKTTKK